MNNEIKEVLNKIESFGFEAYVVGGYVRDFLLNIDTFDVDICTNALPKDIINIFNLKKEISSYGSITMKIGMYTFDITTYRKESNYSGRRPTKIEYTNNLLTDIERRDFTVNSLCMNSKGVVLDLINGREDINKRLIRVIGDVNTKFNEDPLRILRAVRLAIILDFNLDDSIIKYIKNNGEIIRSLSYTRKMAELNKIFSSKNVSNGLKILKELNLTDKLDIRYDNIVVVPDILGIWAQIEYSNKYPFPKSSRNVISNIKEIVKIGVLDNHVMFKYELYMLITAGNILGFSTSDVTNLYNNMPIHSKKDVDICTSDIIRSLEIEPSNLIKEVYNDLINQILDGKLDNSKGCILKYLELNWK